MSIDKRKMAIPTEKKTLNTDPYCDDGLLIDQAI